MSQRSLTFMGFGIRIDILGQGALFAFRQLSMSALVLVGAISKLAMTWWEFERAMADTIRLVAISQGTLEGLGDTMDYLRTSIIKMSSTSVFGVQELTSSLTFLMRAGFDAEEAITELNRAMSLSMAVGLGLSDSVRMIVRLTNMWNRAGRPIVNLLDALAQSEQMFSMEADEMMTALNMAGAVAAEAGLSFGETAAMLGVLVQAGISASSSGTILRRALSALLDITYGARQAMMGLGIDMGVFEAAMPLDRLKILAQHLMAVKDPAQRLQVAFEIFGIRGVNILPVLESMITDFDELATAIDGATDAAIIGEQAFRDTLYAGLTTAANAVTALALTMGEWVMDSAVNFAIAAMGVALVVLILISRYKSLNVNILASNILHLQFIGTMIKNIMVKIKDIVVSLFLAETYKKIGRSIFGAMLATFDYIKGVILGLPAKIADMISNITLAGTYRFLKGAVRGAANAVKKFWTALGPIGLLLILIGGLVMYLIENMGGLGAMMEQFRPLLDAISELFDVLVEVLMELMRAVMPLIDALLKPLFFILKLLMVPLIFVIKAISVFAKITQGMVRIFTTLLGKLFEFLASTGILEMFFTVMQKVMSWVFKLMVNIFNVLIAIINGIIWFINRFLPEDKQITYVAKIVTEDITEEPEEEEEGETAPPEDTSTEPLAPGSPIEPTTDEETTPATTGAGGRGGGGTGTGGVTIYITIVASIDELMDTEGMAERLAILVQQNAMRMRGATP